MDRSGIVGRLTVIFRKIFNNDVLLLSDELTANDVNGWDSLTHMLLIAEIEKEFNIKFKLKELNKMRNVGEMVKMISSKE